jgi:hypothetical protein
MICVLNAAQEAGIPFRAISIKAINNEEHIFGLKRSDLIEDSGKPDFGAETKALVDASAGPIYSFISGVQHVHIGLRPLTYPAEPLFDFVLPEAPHLPLDPGAEIVPADAMRQVIDGAFRSRMKLLRKFAQLAPGRVVQFAPPPPAPDLWIEGLAARHQAGTRRPNGLVRWKIWRLTVDLFRERATSFGARFVDCPPAAVDDQGFMRQEFVRNLTHGNIGFGRLLLEQIRALP